MDTNIINTPGELSDPQNVMPMADEKPSVMSISMPEQQVMPMSGGNANPYIQSFVKDSKDDSSQQALTISFTVVPTSGTLKGIDLMRAVMDACGNAKAEISNLSIRKEEKK